MKLKEKEKGIALIIVLLMITVFTILALSVFSFIISNTKQIDKTETDMQAVDLAEMGVVYYKNAFIKNADAVLNTYLSQAIGILKNNNQPITEALVIDTLNNSINLKQHEGEFKPTVTSLIKLDNPTNNFTFEIKDAVPNYNDSTNEITILFKSIGTMNDYSKEIDTSIKLNLTSNLNNIIQTYIDKSGVTGNITPKIEMNVTKQLTTFNDCTENLLTDFKSCTYNHDINYDPPSTIDSITAVINGSLGMQQGNKQIINSYIYTTKDASFGNLQFLTGLDHSFIFTGGVATFDQLQVTNNSKILVLKDADFNKSINLSSDSLICVGGNITGKGNVTPNGRNIFSWTQDKDSYNNAGVAAGCPRIDVNNTNTSPILPAIDGQINSNINITYN